MGFRRYVFDENGLIFDYTYDDGKTIGVILELNMARRYLRVLDVTVAESFL